MKPLKTLNAGITGDEKNKETSNSNNKDNESICVFRRYSDFETLRNYLVAKYSWVIVPVLPEKAVKIKKEIKINIMLK